MPTLLQKPNKHREYQGVAATESSEVDGLSLLFITH
jgi:hypothetical protein